MNNAKQSWIKCYRKSENPKLKIFCFPFAGGSASAYKKWPDHLADDIDVYAIQLPGREERIREQLYFDLKLCVKEIYQKILPFLDGEFAFFGHSMGAVMAYELASCLQENNQLIPLNLIVSARCAPHIQDPEFKIHDLADNQFLEAIRKYNGTSEVILQNKDLMAMFLPILRADFSMSETYEYSYTLPLRCPVTAICGVEESDLNESHINDWENTTQSDFNMKMFPGGHFFIKDKVEMVLHYLNDRLKEKLVIPQ